MLRRPIATALIEDMTTATKVVTVIAAGSGQTTIRFATYTAATISALDLVSPERLNFTIIS